jgi:iron complex outermembrane receptor protein
MYLIHRYRLDRRTARRDSAAPAVAVACADKARITVRKTKDVFATAASLAGALKTFYMGEGVMRKRTSRVAAVFASLCALGTMSATTSVHAQGGSGAPSAVATNAAPASSGPSNAATAAPDTSLGEIIVTGTNIRGVAPTGSELTAITQDDILASGINTTSELLATVPALASFDTRPRSQGAGLPTTGPDIHGLGPQATLILINGHRVPGQGTLTTGVDPSALPPSMIERVEIVSDGASAVYGSDAVAGVINFILRRNLNGVEVSGQTGFAHGGYREYNANFTAGKTWSTGFLVIGGQYLENTALPGSARSFNTSNLTSIGGTDNRSTQALEPNVTIGNQTFAGPGYAPGTLNKLDVAQLADIVPHETRKSIYLNFGQDITSHIRLFADLGYIDRKTVIDGPQSGATFTITNASPYFKRFGTSATSETINVNLGFYGGPHESLEHLPVFDGNVGVEADLFGDWVGRIGFSGGFSKADVNQFGINQGGLTAAIESTNPATAFDPFDGTGAVARVGTSNNIPSLRQSLEEYSAKADGTLFDLPGGKVKLALGVLRRHERAAGTNYSYTDGVFQGGNVATASRDVTSEYTELFVPIVGDSNAVAGMRSLSLSVAGRHDDYSDFGGTTNPKIGLTWKPIEDLTLRGTWGKSFRAPSLTQINNIGDQVVLIPNISNPGGLTPNNGLSYDVILPYGGNPHLQPERATTYSVGFDFKPEVVPSLVLSGTFFSVKYSNLIDVALDNNIYNNPQLEAAVVTIDPTQAQIDALIAGKILNGTFASLVLPGNRRLLLDDLFKNYGSRTIQGIDFGPSYAFHPEFATFNTGITGTYFTKASTTIIQGGTANDDLRSGFVRFKARYYLSAVKGPFTGNFFVNYVGNYDNPSGKQTVASFTTLDTNLAYELPSAGIFKATLVLNVENLLDKSPPPYNGTSTATAGTGLSGFNGAYANPLGRVVTVGFRAKF